MPARLSSRSSSRKPNGSMRCSVVWVAAQRRATFPVFGGISGSTRTTCINCTIRRQSLSLGNGVNPKPTLAVAGRADHLESYTIAWLQQGAADFDLQEAVAVFGVVLDHRVAGLHAAICALPRVIVEFHVEAQRMLAVH